MLASPKRRAQPGKRRAQPGPPGRLIDIGGRRLHLHEIGRGTPTVILESGIAATSLNWRRVQTEIAKFARVVSYDRAGLGWSDPAGVPLTLARLVDDLHSLLQAAELPPPYILVGHSFGALIVRSYGARYAGEVSGIVLVDPLHTAEWYPLSEPQRTLLARGVRLSHRGAYLARIGLVGWCLRRVLAGSRWLPKTVGRAASGSGVSVMSRLAGEVGKMPREVWPLVAQHWSNPKCFLGMAAHFETLPENARAMSAAAPLPIPAIVLTKQASTAEPERVSTDQRHIVASGSGHWIQLDQPELVAQAVRDLA